MYCIRFGFLVLLCLVTRVQSGRTKRRGRDGADDLLPGHLEFFGSAGTRLDIKLTNADIKPSTVLKEYVIKRQPLVVRKACKDSPAFVEWERDDNLMIRPQSFTTWVKAFDSGLKTQETTFRNFLEKYTKKNWRLALEMPEFLRNEIYMPQFMTCNPVLNQLSQNFLWYSGRDNFGSVHQADTETVTCVISGNVEITLVDPKFSDNMPDVLSAIDVTRVNLKKFPGLRKVEFHKSSVGPGDCVYIPSKWYRQINTYGRYIAVNLTFHSITEDVSKEKCADPRANQTLSYFTFQDRLSIDSDKQNIVLHYFIAYVTNKAVFSLDDLEDHIEQDTVLLANMTEWTEEFQEITREVFQVLDVNKDGVYSLQDLDGLSQQNIEKMRGLLTDRVADYYDIIADQQEDVKDKSGLNMNTEEFITQYVNELENVLVQSINQYVQTGTMPDIKSQMAAMDVKKLLIDQGTSPSKGTGQKQSGDTYNKSRKDAKAKLKEKKESQQKIETEVDGDETEVIQDYVVLDDKDTEDEVLAEVEVEAEPEKIQLDSSSDDNHGKVGSNKEPQEPKTKRDEL